MEFIGPKITKELRERANEIAWTYLNLEEDAEAPDEYDEPLQKETSNQFNDEETE